MGPWMIGLFLFVVCGSGELWCLVSLKGGGWSRFGGNFFLMNFELLTFPCREMIKLSIHI